MIFIPWRTVLNKVLLCAVSYLTAISLVQIYGYGITGIEWLIPCLILFAGFLYYKAVWILRQGYKKQELRYCIPVGFIYALSLVAGSKIEIYDGIFHEVTIMDFFIYPFLGLFFSALTLLLFFYSDRFSVYCLEKENEKKPDKESRKVDPGIGMRIVFVCQKYPYAVLFGLYLLCYLPYYLTFFPGNCGPDTWESLSMAEGLIPWTNHHPVLFTGAMAAVRRLTGFLPMTGSVGVFSFLQMTAMAAVLAYLTLRILRGKNTFVGIFTVGMCALHPFIGMYSIYLSKDVLFSLIMVLLCLQIYDVASSRGELLKKPAECVKLTINFLLASMLRNNGFYITVIMLVFFFFLYRSYRKQILSVFTVSVALFLIWQGPVFKAMGIEKQSFAEAASVPLQQIGYVLWEGGTFSEEDMTFLEELMPVEKVKEVYQPGYTDPYKFDPAFDDAFLNDHVGGFLKVWWHGCTEHFGSYVKAYLMQTVGYWHYGETNSISTQGCTPNDLGVEQIDVLEKITGISLEPLFEKLVLAGRKAPVICMLGSMAMQILMVFLLMLQYIRRKNSGQILWLIPLLVLWGTIMIATPAFCLLRYLFPIFLLWPFMIAEFLKVYYNK